MDASKFIIPLSGQPTGQFSISQLVPVSRLPVSLKKLHHLAIVPKYQTPGSAGADFHAVVGDEADSAIAINPGQTVRVGTGIALHIESPNWSLVLMPRSGLGSKGIILANTVGLFDSDYQGEVLISLYNRSNEPFTVKNGDRVAQGVFMPVLQAAFTLADEFSSVTERGTGGFGSTGK